MLCHDRLASDVDTLPHFRMSTEQPIQLTAEQVKLGRKISRQQRWARAFWAKLPLVRYVPPPPCPPSFQRR